MNSETSDAIMHWLHGFLPHANETAPEGSGIERLDFVWADQRCRVQADPDGTYTLLEWVPNQREHNHEEGN